jgi:hypothetical protein
VRRRRWADVRRRPVLRDYGETRAPIIAYAWPQNYFELRRAADQIASRMDLGLPFKLEHRPDVGAAADWSTLSDHLRLTANSYIRRVERTMTDMDQSARGRGVWRSSLERHALDTTRPIFKLDIDSATVAPWAVTPKPVVSIEEDFTSPKIERLRLISDDELERANLMGRLVEPNREIVEVGHGLAAVSELKLARMPFDFAIVMPPCAGLTIRELGQQLKRIDSERRLGLIDPPIASGDFGPYDVVNARPITVGEIGELVASWRMRSDAMT